MLLLVGDYSGLILTGEFWSVFILCGIKSSRFLGESLADALADV